MEDEVRKKLKCFEDVLLLLNDMIRNIDNLMETMNNNPEEQDKALKRSNNKDVSGNLLSDNSRTTKDH